MPARTTTLLAWLRGQRPDRFQGRLRRGRLRRLHRGARRPRRARQADLPGLQQLHRAGADVRRPRDCDGRGLTKCARMANSEYCTRSRRPWSSTMARSAATARRALSISMFEAYYRDDLQRAVADQATSSAATSAAAPATGRSATPSTDACAIAGTCPDDRLHRSAWCQRRARPRAGRRTAREAGRIHATPTTLAALLGVACAAHLRDAELVCGATDLVAVRSPSGSCRSLPDAGRDRRRCPGCVAITRVTDAALADRRRRPRWPTLEAFAAAHGPTFTPLILQDAAGTSRRARSSNRATLAGNLVYRLADRRSWRRC
jgi:hypothetical protein